MFVLPVLASFCSRKLVYTHTVVNYDSSSSFTFFYHEPIDNSAILEFLPLIVDCANEWVGFQYNIWELSFLNAINAFWWKIKSQNCWITTGRNKISVHILNCSIQFIMLVSQRTEVEGGKANCESINAFVMIILVDLWKVRCERFKHRREVWIIYTT